MRFPRWLLLSALVPLVVPLALSSCTGSGDAEQRAMSSSEGAPNIQGTYRLLSRELPDGTILTPPQIMGLLTYTETHRSITVVGEDALGKFFAMRGATYTLSPTEYSETVLFRATNLSAGSSDRTRIDYDVPGSTLSTPVTVAGDRIEFELADEPVFKFEGATLTATHEGQFVDTWERVR